MGKDARNLGIVRILVNPEKNTSITVETVDMTNEELPTNADIEKIIQFSKKLTAKLKTMIIIKKPLSAEGMEYIFILLIM